MILAFRTFALRQFVGDKWSMSIRRLLFIVVCFLLGATHNAMGQSSVYGYGPYVNSVPLPVENGYVDAVNGNLHLEIPITAIAERGHVPFVAKFEYDSHIWQQVAPTGPISWQPTNIPNSNGGWRYVSPASGQMSHITDLGSCSDRLLGDLPYSEYYGFTWTAPDGRQIPFAGVTHRGNKCIVALTSFDSIASDASGYHIYVTNYVGATIYAPDGTQVYPTIKDTNGNFYSGDGNGNLVDTLGRTPVTVTTGTNQIFYDVLNSQNHTSRFTVNTTSISAKTAFGQSNVTECTTSCTLTVISSIGLPDGTSYSFKYDCDTSTNSSCGSTSGHSSYYGVLTSMTLPTGAVITYTHTNFKDASNNQYLWVTSRASSGTWNYTPQTCGTTCQKYTVAQPSGDQELYQFTLYGYSMWNTTASFYSGSATLLESVQTDYTTTAPIQAIRVTTTVPSAGGVSLSKKTEITYDTSKLGNVMNQNQWQFYSGSFPTTQDRKTSYAYLTNSNNNMVNKQTSVQVFAGASTTATSSRFISYDSTGVVGSPTGVVNHDDTNFPASYTARGNPTSISYGVTAVTLTYDLTGQVTKSQDPAGNLTAFDYTDNFFDDASGGATPHTTSTPTHAFVKTVALPSPFQSWTNTAGYYWGTGKIAKKIDQNNQTTTFDYLDSLDRFTQAVLPNGGWLFNRYFSTTLYDSFKSITDTTPSPNCTFCRFDRITLDNMGRPISTTLESDPEGNESVVTSYDSSSRVQSVSTPYRSTSDLTYNLNTYSRDGLGRVTKVTHTDGTYSSAYYGAAVTSGVGGITTQLCSSATYGLGFPTLFVDEAQKKREVWTDGFGRTIEVDEPNNSGTLSQNTCYTYDVMNNLTGVTQGSQSRFYTYYYQYDGTGVLGQATTPESGTVTYSYGCSGILTQVCTRVDARNVTATYAYDQLNRLKGITYTGGTPATPSVTYSYDFGTNQNGFRTGMIDGSGSTTWTNNAVGWVLTEQRTIAGKTNTISYAYNLDGSIKSITYPSGRTVTYSTSIAERAVSAIDSANNIQYALTASYAPVGALNSVIYGKVNSGFGGITETRTYNNRLEFNSIVASSATGTAESLNFNYGTTTNNGTLGKITNNVTPGLNETFGYDYLNRVTSGATASNSVTGCWGQSFGTTGNPPDDQWSNLTQINSTQCTTGTLSVGVSTATNHLSATGYGFDNAGNMTGDGTYTYTFDAENHLTKASGMSGGPWNYAYDGNGLRVEKSNGSSGTMYWRAISGETIAESDLTGSTTNPAYREYIFFAGRRIASRDSATPTPNVYFYYTDHLGSTTAITTASGTVCYQANFTPYGEEHTTQATTCPQNYKFTGYERDNETQLDYAFARYYNSHLGRFMSADPMGGVSTDPQSLNRYAYVGNSAVNSTDPSGMFKHPCVDRGTGGGVCSYDDGFSLAQYFGGSVVYGFGFFQTDSFFFNDKQYGVFTLEPYAIGVMNWLLGGGGGGGGSAKDPCDGIRANGGGTIKATQGTFEFNANGFLTGISVNVTTALPQQADEFMIPSNTSVTVSLTGAGSGVAVSFSNPVTTVYGFFGAAVSMAQFENGKFTQILGAVTMGFIPLGSTNSPSSKLLSEFNQNTSALQLASGLQQFLTWTSTHVNCELLFGGKP